HPVTLPCMAAVLKDCTNASSFARMDGLVALEVTRHCYVPCGEVGHAPTKDCTNATSLLVTGPSKSTAAPSQLGSKAWIVIPEKSVGRVTPHPSVPISIPARIALVFDGSPSVDNPPW